MKFSLIFKVEKTKQFPNLKDSKVKGKWRSKTESKFKYDPIKDRILEIKNVPYQYVLKIFANEEMFLENKRCDCWYSRGQKKKCHPHISTYL